jgi:hypothetical protein
MKKIKSRSEWMSEGVNPDAVNEDELVDIDIMLDAEPEMVIKSIELMNGVKKKEVLPFGVIKAKAPKNAIADIKKLDGVEDVEVIDKAKKIVDKF